MASSTHSDSDLDSPVTVSGHLVPFSPATRLLLSPRKLRSHRGPPHTPERHHDYLLGTPSAPARPQGSPGPTDEDQETLHCPTYKDAERDNGREWKIAKVPPWEMLYRKLNDMYAILPKRSEKPAINRAARNAKMHERVLKVVNWDDLREHDDPERFLDVLFEDQRGAHHEGPGDVRHKGLEKAMAGLSLKGSEPRPFVHGVEEPNPFARHARTSGEPSFLRKVLYFPQTERLLLNEANASEAFLSNALNPVVAVVGQFLPAKWRPHPVGHDQPVGPGLHVLCSGQHPLAGAEDESGRPSALDLTFALVSWPPNAEPKFRFDLVICELKRPGYVLHEHWQDQNFHPKHKVHEHPSNLLRQLMLYNHRSSCERFILSDYLSTVAVHVDYPSMKSPNAPVVVGAKPVTFKNQSGCPQDPYSGGPGTAIAYEIAMALRALGCTDKRLFPLDEYEDKEGRYHRVQLHPDIKEFLEKNDKYSPQD
ncbi:hypothetical protein JCM3770_003766 [Rhodotorula araucariae]